jgi:5-methylcytosine-specific restriction endonuclease McrA
VYCGQIFTPAWKTSVVCSKVCSRRVSYARYREERIAKAVAWAKANRDARAAITNQYKAQRRLLEKQAEGSTGVSSKEWVRMLRRYRHRCAYCGSDGPIHMEHVIPVSRGGRHAIGNVLPACETCNLSKQSCLVAEWKLRKIRLARLRATMEAQADGQRVDREQQALRAA